MTPWTQRPLAWIKQAVQFEQLLEFILALLDQRLEVTIVLLEGDVVFLEQLQQLTVSRRSQLPAQRGESRLAFAAFQIVNPPCDFGEAHRQPSRHRRDEPVFNREGRGLVDF